MTMNRDEAKSIIVQSLARIAPEADAASIDPRASLREQLDLDSMDFLNFAIALHDRLHVDIPEKDYGKIDSLDACAEYLLAHGASP